MVYEDDMSIYENTKLIRSRCRGSQVWWISNIPRVHVTYTKSSWGLFDQTAITPFIKPYRNSFGRYHTSKNRLAERRPELDRRHTRGVDASTVSLHEQSFSAKISCISCFSIVNFRSINRKIGNNHQTTRHNVSLYRSYICVMYTANC